MFQRHQKLKVALSKITWPAEDKNLERIDCIFLKLSNYITVLIVIIEEKCIHHMLV